MSALQKIKELDAQREKLLTDAKEEALTQATEAVSTLRELGFNYSLVEGKVGGASRSAGGRRTGVKATALKAITNSDNGMTRAQILEAMDAQDDKSAQNSISTALANLKKEGKVTNDDGIYKPAS